jgi:hypothetical protein
MEAIALLIAELEPEAQALVVLLVKKLHRVQTTTTIDPIPAPLPAPKP